MLKKNVKKGLLFPINPFFSGVKESPVKSVSLTRVNFTPVKAMPGIMSANGV